MSTTPDTPEVDSGSTSAQRQRRAAVIAVVLVVIGVLVIGAALLSARPGPPSAESDVAQQTSESTETASLEASESAEPTAAVTEPMVEVPDLIGLSVAEAEIVLGGAGLGAEVKLEGEPLPAGSASQVLYQSPGAGELLEPGSPVLLTAQPVAKPAAPKSATPSTGSYVVVLDPGHQASSDQTPEPIGPGASETKPRVTGGATGVETGVPEYEVVLQVAMNVKRRLEAKGVKVVMTRTTNDVNLSNSERAAVANKNDADLFLRIHADGSPDRKVSGMSTLYPASNRWTKPIAAESKAAAGAVHSAMVDATGAVDRGTVARTDIAGFNWSEVPAILVEIGFLTHPVEDKLLVSPHYQDTVAEGIAAGTLAHLKQGG